MFSTVVGNIQENKRFNNMLLILLDSVSIWVMASVMGCCIILARFYDNVGLGSNDSFFPPMCVFDHFTPSRVFSKSLAFPKSPATFGLKKQDSLLKPHIKV